jgi:putative lipoic acid-binding regulatory protein
MVISNSLLYQSLKTITYLCLMDIDVQYDNLLLKLKEDFNWPQLYMFKFIIALENDAAKSTLLLLFSGKANIQHKSSSGGKYASYTITEKMISAESVIEIYKKVASIPGVMAL